MQLVLPTVDMRPLCAICRQPADVLGQLHPRLRHLACPDCCAKYAVPDYVRLDASYSDRVTALEIELELRALLIPPPRLRPLFTNTLLVAASQNSLPVCYKCGRVHDRNTWGRYADTCQRCEDRSTVESIWARRSIWAQDDPEGVLDRLYAAFPGLFERGVLPDAWFMMMRRRREDDDRE